MHEEDREWVRARVEQQANREYDIQYRIVRPDGELRWIWDRAVPIRDEQGRVDLNGLIRELTDSGSSALDVVDGRRASCSC